MYQSTNPLFKSLDDAEEAEFTKYAQDNPPPIAPAYVMPMRDDRFDQRIHHPVCCAEWRKRGFKDISE